MVHMFMVEERGMGVRKKSQGFQQMQTAPPLTPKIGGMAGVVRGMGVAEGGRFWIRGTDWGSRKRLWRLQRSYSELSCLFLTRVPGGPGWHDLRMAGVEAGMLKDQAPCPGWCGPVGHCDGIWAVERSLWKGPRLGDLLGSNSASGDGAPTPFLLLKACWLEIYVHF